MPRVAPAVPAESDLLCESCGYTLNGLPDDGRCPECGTAVADSAPETRRPTAWERRRSAGSPSAGAFWADTAGVVFRPGRFFRTLATRGSLTWAKAFAIRHQLMSALLFAVAALLHAETVFQGWRLSPLAPWFWVAYAASAPLVLMAFVLPALWAITWAAARLTTLEGTYRGLRLPYPAVLRVLNFHAADYLPVALLAVATTGGYLLLTRAGVLGYETLFPYLYVLSAEVVLAAGYLFNTYWRAMRATMYANA